jgi:hypothetical protein
MALVTSKPDEALAGRALSAAQAASHLLTANMNCS